MPTSAAATWPRRSRSRRGRRRRRSARARRRRSRAGCRPRRSRARARAHATEAAAHRAASRSSPAVRVRLDVGVVRVADLVVRRPARSRSGQPTGRRVRVTCSARASAYARRSVSSSGRHLLASRAGHAQSVRARPVAEPHEPDRRDGLDVGNRGDRPGRRPHARRRGHPARAASRIRTSSRRSPPRAAAARPLDAALATSFGGALGRSVSDVRVHTDDDRGRR